MLFPVAEAVPYRPIRRSLDDNAVATLVHAFVGSRVDYCGSLFVGTRKKTTDKLQRVLNAAVRLVSNTCKYDRGLTHIRTYRYSDTRYSDTHYSDTRNSGDVVPHTDYREVATKKSKVSVTRLTLYIRQVSK